MLKLSLLLVDLSFIQGLEDLFQGWHHGRLSYPLQCQHALSALAQVPDTPLPILLSANGLGKQRKNVQVLGLLIWETWKNLLALVWFTSGHCGHLGSKPDERSLSFPVSLSVSLILLFKYK